MLVLKANYKQKTITTKILCHLFLCIEASRLLPIVKVLGGLFYFLLLGLGFFFWKGFGGFFWKTAFTLYTS